MAFLRKISSINFKKARKFLVFLFLFLFVLGAAAIFEIWADSHFINAQIAGINIAFKSFDEAALILKNNIDQYLNQELDFIIDNNKVKQKLSDLGAGIDIEKTLKNALKKQNFSPKYYFNLINQIGSFFSEQNYEIEAFIDENKIDKIIADKWARYQNLPRDAFIEKINNDFIVHKSTSGKIIDKSDLKQKLIQALSKLDTAPIVLELKPSAPRINDQAAKEALNEALVLLEKKRFSLKYKNESWPIPKEAIYDIISFETKNSQIIIKPDEEEVENFLTQIAPLIAQKPQNAILATDDKNNLIVAQKDQSGREIEIKESVASFIKSFLEGNENIEIIIKELPASLREDNYRELGITTLLGVGVTNFFGSAASRVHNIKVGAAKFNGLLVAPEEEFSFNSNLGEIGPQQGYLPGLVIKDNKTVPEYGGGICQVSTTLFQAAVKAGLKITERSPHAYPVAFYKPPGFDATIYSPYTDLKFINPTNGYIYIQSEVKGNEIFFRIFGPSEGRQVKLKGPIIYQKNEDGSMKTVLTQEVYDKENNLLFKKSFYSNYKSPSLYPILRNPLE